MQKTSTERDGQRFYGDLPSVTTVLQAIAKPALLPWYARQTAAEAVDAMAHGLTIDDLADLYPQTLKRPLKYRLSATVAAERYLAGAPNRHRGASANLGTLVHAVADAESRNAPWPDLGDTDAVLAMSYAEQFRKWQDDYRPEFVLQEVEVVNHSIGYGGRLDAIVTLGRSLMLLDYKTGKDVYPEVALQLEAYAHADAYLQDGEEVPLPAISRLGVLHLLPDTYHFLEIIPSDLTWPTFIAARDLWGWQQSTKAEAWAADVPGAE